MYNSILLRYGEVGIKSRRKRPYFERLYISAIKEALKRNGVPFQALDNFGGRFILLTDDIEDALETLQLVPGVQSISPATKIDFSSYEDAISKLTEHSKDLVKDKTFRVTSRRTGTHSFSSMEFSAKLGEKVMGFSKGVDLHNPEITVWVEIRDKELFVYTESIPCLDGMPPSSSGKLLCLFSGGLDSPVAAYHMLKRGGTVDYLLIDLVGGDKSFNSVAKVYNHIITQYSYNQTPKFHVVPARYLVEQITKDVDPSMRQLALKIAFYKIAERLVEKHNYNAAFTGESLSQKSSQTLPSLRFIQSQSDVFMLRPLIAMDKLEITRTAEKIGTFGASQCVEEFCDLSEGQSVTAVPIDKDHDKIPDYSALVDKVVEETKSYEGIISIQEDKKEIPSDVITVDLRLKSKHEKDILETDKNIYFYDALDDIDQFEKTKKYVFVCEHGVQSQSLVYALKQKNIISFAMSRKEYIDWKN